MQVHLTNRTRPNKIAQGSDTEYLWDNEAGVCAVDNIIEYAARVCYKSTPKMRTAPGFIGDLIARGHEDVTEHSWVVFSFTGMDYGEYTNAHMWKHIAEELQFFTPFGYQDELMVAGNLRSWLQLIRHGSGPDELILPFLKRVSPGMFGQPEDAEVYRDRIGLPVQAGSTPSGANVSLLGYSYTPNCADHINHATFLIEGISRACSHQIVRHRKCSFSQESQRYVDLSKGQWKAVIPPHADESDKDFFAMFWEDACRTYDLMRTPTNTVKAMRKEDARMVLPNMTSTRMVMSAPMNWWRHFIWQRAAKDAQWEIRDVTIQVIRQLHQVSPNFEKEMEHFGVAI